MNINQIGWSPVWEEAFTSYAEKGYYPARVGREHKGGYVVITDSGERTAKVSGHFRHVAPDRSSFPVVGDWVALDIKDETSRCIIHDVLPRTSIFSRKAAGHAEEKQVLATNLDTVFLVSGLDHDFNLRRIERYLTLAYESNVKPVIILNKADIADDLENAQREAAIIAAGVPILTVSATNATGITQLWEHVRVGTTCALIGSSGVGKSSLINALLGGEMLKTSAVRDYDSRGRHTTTHRELVPLPNGAVLIDTPGMRELQLVADEVALARSFDEITELASDCRFNDCTHTVEVGCAVKTAMESGILDQERYDSYIRQRAEILHQQEEQDIHLRINKKKQWKAIKKSLRFHPKHNKYKNND